MKYYVNGKRVRAKDFLDALRINLMVICDFERFKNAFGEGYKEDDYEYLDVGYSSYIYHLAEHRLNSAKKEFKLTGSLKETLRCGDTIEIR